MGHPDVGVFLNVYQKLATMRLLKTAARWSSDNLAKPDMDEAHWKRCLGIADENAIRFICVSHYKGGARKHTHTQGHSNAIKAFATLGWWAIQSNSLVIHVGFQLYCQSHFNCTCSLRGELLNKTDSKICENIGVFLFQFVRCDSDNHTTKLLHHHRHTPSTLTNQFSQCEVLFMWFSY